MYKGVFGRKKFYYIQDSDLVPPIFPMTKSNKLVWSNIQKVDVKELKDYMDWIKYEHSRHRSKKRKLDDIVDMENRMMNTKSKTEGFSTVTLYKSSYSHWNSSNALPLFNPKIFVFTKDL